MNFVTHVVTGVDETVVVSFKFSKNRMAVLTCSACVQLPNEAIIVSTKGTIKVGHYSQATYSKYNSVWNVTAVCTVHIASPDQVSCEAI